MTFEKMMSCLRDISNQLGSGVFDVCDEDEMKERLGIKEGKGDCGCGCKGTTPGGCGDTIKDLPCPECGTPKSRNIAVKISSLTIIAPSTCSGF